MAKKSGKIKPQQKNGFENREVYLRQEWLEDLPRYEGTRGMPVIKKEPDEKSVFEKINETPIKTKIEAKETVACPVCNSQMPYQSYFSHMRKSHRGKEFAEFKIQGPILISRKSGTSKKNVSRNLQSFPQSPSSKSVMNDNDDEPRDAGKDLSQIRR